MIGFIGGAIIIGVAGAITKNRLTIKNQKNKENVKKIQNYTKSQMLEKVKSDYQQHASSLEMASKQSLSISHSLSRSETSESLAESLATQETTIFSSLAAENLTSQSVYSSEESFTELISESEKEELFYSQEITDQIESIQSNEINLSENDFSLEASSITQEDIDISYQKVDLSEQTVENICTKLGEKLDDNKLIGYDLLQVLGNQEAIDYLYRYTRNSLLMNYNRTGNYIGDQRKIIITLILIAYEYYDGSYWDHVADVFASVYKKRNTEKLNGILRSIINHYAIHEARQINYVIRQTITPKYYLSDFIEFVFDIYKHDFQYEIMEEHLNEYLKNILFSLSEIDTKNSRNQNASYKKYTLIKTTKSIIDNPEWFGELIMYTRLILQYIDQVYWNNNYEGLPYREFLEPIFRDWVTKHNTLFFKDRVHGEHKKTKWSPTFSLKENKIILTIPNHILNQDIIPSRISLHVCNGKEVLQIIDHPFIEQIMAGYLLKQVVVSIRQPLGYLYYAIYDGKQLLYSSQQSLYRDYLLFDDHGKELKLTRQYTGQIDICSFKGSCQEGTKYYEDEQYELRTMEISSYDTLTIDDRVISFMRVKDYQIEGSKTEHVSIRVQNMFYPLYHRVEMIRFALDEEKEWGLRINEERYRSSSLDNVQSVSLSQGVMISIPIASLLSQGFNYVELFDCYTGEKIYSLFLFIDVSFHCDTLEKDGQISLALQSCLTSQKVISLDLTKQNYNEVSFESSYFSYLLYLAVELSIPLYRIDGSSWRTLHHSIWKDDFHNYSKLWLDGFSFDHALVLDEQGRQIQTIAKDTLKRKQYIQLASLVTLQGSHQFVSIVFIDQDIAIASLKIYYQNILLGNTFKAACDEETGQIQISFSYIGRDIIHISLQDQHEVYFKNDVMCSPVKLTIDDVETFKNMDLVITAGTNDLFSLSSNEYEIAKKSVSFYSLRDIVGKTLTVIGMWGERYNSQTKSWDDQRRPMKNTYLIVDKKIDSAKFKGRIAYLYEHDAISEDVDILITSEIDKGGFWCSLYIDEDLLLFDMKKKTILFDESSPEASHAIPISECKCKY